MIGPQLFRRAGIASSIAAHVVVVAWVVFGSGVRLFEPAPAEAITVDLVTPEEAKAALGNGEGAPPEEAKQDEPSQSIVPGSKQTTPDLPAQQSEPVEQPREKAEKTTDEQVTQQAAVQPPPSPAPIPRAEPDITEKYGTMFGLNDSGYDPIKATAKIPPGAVATFRAHLKTCSTLPETVSPGDDVRVVLRVGLLPSGNLAAAPSLIEASASAKGPLLMQAAIKALQACQPYNMLPGDRYQEWRVLDLPFTPKDFAGG